MSSLQRVRRSMLPEITILFLLSLITAAPASPTGVLPVSTDNTSINNITSKPASIFNALLPQPTILYDIESLKACPPPLISITSNITTSFCLGGCCLPCPSYTVFYEPHKLESRYTIASVFRVLSTISCLLLVAFYSFLPSQRKHTRTIVFVFVMVVIPWNAFGTWWFYRREKLLCKSLYEAANFSNSWECGVQGVSLTFLSITLFTLGFLLIANMYLLVVHNSYLIQNNSTYFIILSLAIPASIVTPIALKKEIGGFGSICFVGAKMSGNYLFIPYSVIICLAIVLYISTVISLFKSKWKTNRATNQYKYGFNTDSSSSHRSSRFRQILSDISLLFRQQWRPGVLTIYLLTMILINWTFYFIEGKKLVNIDVNSDGYQNWVGCLARETDAAFQSGKLSSLNPTPEQVRNVGLDSQRQCSYAAKSWAPNFLWASLCDILPAIFGVLLLIIFGTRVELWNDLKKQVLRRRPRSSDISKSNQNTDTDELDLAKISEDSTDRVYNGESRDTSIGNHRPSLGSSLPNTDTGLGETNITKPSQIWTGEFESSTRRSNRGDTYDAWELGDSSNLQFNQNQNEDRHHTQSKFNSRH